MTFRALLIIAAAANAVSGEPLSQDNFQPSLTEGWTWIREVTNAWRVRDGALEVRIVPGNMWGPANDARNVLVRPAPAPDSDPLEISVTVSNRPSEQYEQVDLVWYYDDGHMVKIGEELVDGKLSIVMGREERDRTRTIAIIPLTSFTVELRLTVATNRLRGAFCIPGDREWREAGECSLPIVKGKEPKISLQCYQGPEDAEHWARISNFKVRRLADISNAQP